MEQTGVTEPESPGAQGAADGRKQVRGSALLVVGRVAAMVIGLATQVLIVRALSIGDFGAFAYALALAAAARVLLSLGQGKLLSRFMAKYEEEQDYARMFGAMFLAVGTIAVTSVVAIIAAFLFSGALLGGSADNDTAVDLFLIMIFLAPLEALDMVFVSLFAVFSKPRAIFFRKYLMTPGLRLVVVLLLVILESSVKFLAIGYVIASVVGIMLYFFLLVRVLRERGLLKQLDIRKVVFPVKAVFAFSFPLITSELVLLSLNVGGVIILELSTDSMEDVGIYRSVFNSARLNTAVTAAFVTLFLPVIARLFARADLDGLRRTYWQTAAFVAVLTFPIFALTGPLAPTTTVALFQARYAEAGTVLALLSVGYYCNVMLGFNAYTLQVCERIRYLVGVNVVVMALNIGLCFLWAPEYAATGVAAANCAALVTQNLMNQWALRRSMQTAFIDRSCVRCYLVIVGCSLALWAFQVLVEPGVVLCLLAAGVASLIVLYASRSSLELTQTFPELARIPVLGRLLR